MKVPFFPSFCVFFHIDFGRAQLIASVDSLVDVRVTRIACLNTACWPSGILEHCIYGGSFKGEAGGCFFTAPSNLLFYPWNV